MNELLCHVVDALTQMESRESDRYQLSAHQHKTYLF